MVIEIKKIDRVYQTLLFLEKDKKEGVTAREIAGAMEANRANISRYLNQLYRNGKLKKIEGRPVLYKSLSVENKNPTSRSLDTIVGAKLSLSKPIQQAKAAIYYPPRGLHTLLLGGTGVGKTMFAELMHRFAIETENFDKKAPFVQFNCADYADNPQLLIGHIFGVKKGAYTGASRDRDGLLKKADRGILFLDEVHRLSPQGQEMLFTYIDKGYFRPLGETDKEITADVLIIAATTEKPESYLLSTFIRRIPMMITLPSLRERGLEERYLLIESFLKEESKRVGRSIYINKNSLISLLLYDCPNNIGQLNSDIQLACGRAFLTFKTENKEYMMITQSELPDHVKKGIMKIHQHRKDVEDILKEKGEILNFSYKDKNISDNSEATGSKFFYDIIEKKLNSLREVNIKEERINEILNIDIESYFKKHLDSLPAVMKKDEVRKIVDDKTASMVEKILKLASKRLNRDYDKKIYFGLALHLQKSIERIQNGEKIYHPELNHIRVTYPEEFMVAMEVAKFIDDKYRIEVPLDEIGYISMFLSSNPYRTRGKERQKTGILVIMHGSSTASSMVEVANELVGDEHAVALDMPLNIDPETIFKKALEEVIKIDQGRGVLLLVDMGSLSNFGDMISEKTGRKIETIEMVSTPVVIDACRKAMLGQDLYQIYRSCKDISINRKRPQKKKVRKKAIITTCFTGEGASVRLKEIIADRLQDSENIEIISLNILNHEHFLTTLKQYEENYKILAVVGTVDIELEEIPFISAVDVLSGDGIGQIEDIIKNEEIYLKIEDSLKEHIKSLNTVTLVDLIRKAIKRIEKKLTVKISEEVRIGIVLHISFLVEKLIKGDSGIVFSDLEKFQKEYKEEMADIKQSLLSLENKYKIVVGDDELAYLCQMFLENKERY